METLLDQVNMSNRVSEDRTSVDLPLEWSPCGHRWISEDPPFGRKRTCLESNDDLAVFQGGRDRSGAN